VKAQFFFWLQEVLHREVEGLRSHAHGASGALSAVRDVRGAMKCATKRRPERQARRRGEVARPPARVQGRQSCAVVVFYREAVPCR